MGVILKLVHGIPVLTVYLFVSVLYKDKQVQYRPRVTSPLLARNSRVLLILPREQQALHAGVVKAARGQAHTYTEMPRTCELASRSCGAREPVTRRSRP